MTGDRDADLYVRFKYRPTKNRFDCRPFRADSNEECEMVVPAGQTKLYIKVDGGAAGASVQVKGVKQIPGSGIEWTDIKELLNRSVAPPATETVSTGGVSAMAATAVLNRPSNRMQL